MLSTAQIIVKFKVSQFGLLRISVDGKSLNIISLTHAVSVV